MGVKEEEEQPGEELQTLMGGGEPGTKNGVAAEESSPTHFALLRLKQYVFFYIWGV